MPAPGGPSWCCCHCQYGGWGPKVVTDRPPVSCSRLACMSAPVIVIVGAGPGLGAAIARRFGRHAYSVALISSDETQVENLGKELQAAGVTAGWTAADITDSAAFRA